MSSSASFDKVGECLYRNPSSGTYYALVKIRGKQIKNSLKTKTLVEARRKLKAKREELEAIDPEQGKITLSALCDKYLLTIKSQSNSTKVGKNGVIKRVKSEWPGGADRLIQKIKPSEALEFLATYEGASRHRQALEVLRSMFSIALKDRMIARSPVEGLHQRKPRKPIRITPSVEDFQRIIEEIRTQPLSDTAEESADFVEFLGLAGLGQAEAASLTWGDVDFTRQEITTFRHKTSTGFRIPIYPQLMPLIEKRRQMAIEQNEGKLPKADTKVFSILNAKVGLANACRRLELPNYSSRAFRRMFITLALERGVDVKVVAQWQGHQDGGKLILDTYSHVRPSRSQEMAKLMSAHSQPGKAIPAVEQQPGHGLQQAGDPQTPLTLPHTAKPLRP